MNRKLAATALFLCCTLYALSAFPKNKDGKYSAVMAANLPGAIGKALYANGYSRLYRSDITMKNLKDSMLSGELNLEGYGLLTKQLNPIEIPLLEPLTITSADYMPQFEALVIHLKFPDGKEAVSISNDFMLERGAKNGKGDFMTMIAGKLMTAIPPTLTEKDIQAIKNRTLYRGMDEDVATLGLGLPEHENTWGDGGKQLVYLGSTMFVYVNAQGKVENWQILGH
jgi:hypothetical protein